jgi:hypothetical protein
VTFTKSSVEHTTRAGFPEHTVSGGISLVTTEPAPTMALGPMVTLHMMVELAPMKLRSRIVTLPTLMRSPAKAVVASWVRMVTNRDTVTSSPISRRYGRRPSMYDG